MILYHGSKEKFEEFKFDFLGKNGTGEGKGFYFTTSEELASKYADKGYLYIVDAQLNKSLNENLLTISKEKYITLIEAYEKHGGDFLSNYGEVDYEGIEKVIARTVEAEYESAENDVELIGSMINATDDIEKIHELLYDLFEITHIESHSELAQGHDATIYVILQNKFIKIMNVEERNEWE